MLYTKYLKLLKHHIFHINMEAYVLKGMHPMCGLYQLHFIAYHVVEVACSSSASYGYCRGSSS